MQWSFPFLRSRAAAEDIEGGHRKARPFRLGIWCYYGVTLTPDDGIGVFVHNLVAGLRDLGEPLEVVLLVRPGDQHVAEPFAGPGPCTVRAVPAAGWRPPLWPPRPNSLMMAWTAATDRLAAWWHALRGGFEPLRRWAGVPAEKFTQAAWRWLDDGKKLPVLCTGLALPPAFLLACAGRALVRLTAALGAELAYPLRSLDGLVRRLARHPRFALNAEQVLPIVRAADCDVWVIPHVGFSYPITFPAVLFIHDLVTHHFPEMFDPGMVERVEACARARPAEATLCGCMSAFIRDTDLLGVLGLPPAKVRMIRPAAPQDFPNVGDAEADRLLPACLTRPYLLYPAAFRGYKNHRALVEALHRLRQHGADHFDLAFTGSAPKQLPNDLKVLIERYGLAARVHLLGRVDRRTLAALYKRAFALVMPSLYEQGSFPVYEALYWGCPVACSRIPPLVEQCQAMGDAMLYFDPHDPETIAQAVLAIAADWEGVRVRQREASHALWQRTWKDVAREWLAVFREAARLGYPGRRAA